MPPRGWISRRRRFPITVEVVNEFAKGYGLLPLNFTNEFSSILGRYATIEDPDGDIYRLRYSESKIRGMVTNGWCKFIDLLNMHLHAKVILHYVGESYFRMNFDDQTELNNEVEINVKAEVDSVYEQTNPFHGVPMHNSTQVPAARNVKEQIRLTPYSISQGRQHLPAGFVERYLNLRLKSVAIMINDGRKWTCGLYHPKRRASEARINKGWKKFCTDLNLQPSDHLSFEVVDGNENLLRAHIN